jgi:hypothetical protein
MRTNSNPILLNTIKMPRDMLRLKAILPEKRYKNAHVEKFKSDLSELINKNEIKIGNNLIDNNAIKEKSVKNFHSLIDISKNEINLNKNLVNKDHDNSDKKLNRIELKLNNNAINKNDITSKQDHSEIPI